MKKLKKKKKEIEKKMRSWNFGACLKSPKSCFLSFTNSDILVILYSIRKNLIKKYLIETI